MLMITDFGFVKLKIKLAYAKAVPPSCVYMLAGYTMPKFSLRRLADSKNITKISLCANWNKLRRSKKMTAKKLYNELF